MSTRRNRPNTRTHRRGIVAVLAMLFMVLITTLGLAMFGSATLNVQATTNLQDLDRARAAAESGLRWQSYRINQLRPKSTVGNLTAPDAATIWTTLRNSIRADYLSLPSPGLGTIDDTDPGRIGFSGMPLDGSGARFAVIVEKLPEYITDQADPRYRQFIRVTSTGIVNPATARETRRSVSMVFTLDKKVRFAVIGRTRIQLGRNVLVEGPVAMATNNLYPPLLALSDFRHLDPALTAEIDRFHAFLRSNPGNFDNRVSVAETSIWDAALAEGFADVNGDFHIDEFDLFMAFYDTNGDGRISSGEFTNSMTGQMVDAELFAAIDSLGAPLRTGETPRVGYNDGYIDSNDLYAKVFGEVMLAPSLSSWNNVMPSGQTVSDYIAGPIHAAENGMSAVRFGVSAQDLFDLNPQNFNTQSFKDRTGSAAGPSSVGPTLIANTTLTPAMANGGTVNERTPFGSVSFQATYRRPVFRNLTFRNIRIPKGLNALFDNCTFEGTTFIELHTNITRSNGTTTTSASDGMTWSRRMISGSFSATTVLTAANSHGFNLGNNLRFHGCTFMGPLASDVPTAYTHFTNSWDFTGATRFDNQADQTATIVAPQTNIEMGSFTNPLEAPSTLVGVVVAGNIDIRGTSIVDGSVIVTGDGARDTTLGWFGPSDDQTDPSAMPEGGFGRLNIRYNPYRTLPDGIDIKVDILPQPGTYVETIGATP